MNKLKIIYDTDCQNPREDFDCYLGTIAYNHNNYELGEEEISDPIDWLIEKLGLKDDQVDRWASKHGYYMYSDETKEHLETLFFKKYIALSVYIYDHSGIALSTTPFGCRWDSGQIGYIYTTKEKVRGMYNISRITKSINERVIFGLELEIKEFDKYVKGEYFGFVIEDEDENHLDSCWGFIGRDFETNGLLEHIDNETYFPNLIGEEFIELVNNTEVEVE